MLYVPWERCTWKVCVDAKVKRTADIKELQMNNAVLTEIYWRFSCICVIHDNFYYNDFTLIYYVYMYNTYSSISLSYSALSTCQCYDLRRIPSCFNTVRIPLTAMLSYLIQQGGVARQRLCRVSYCWLWVFYIFFNLLK